MSQPERYLREMSWGEALAYDVGRQPGGLKQIHARISRVMGPMYGSRNTFGKLFDFSAVPEPENPKDRQRAWLLIAAIGQKPEAWGLGDADRPPLLDDPGRLNRAIPGWTSSPIDVAA